MTRLRVLVTGAGGFVGRHLVELINNLPDADAFGTYHNPTSGSTEPVAKTLAGVYSGDLADEAFAETVVREARPNWIVHLAAQASVADSWRDPGRTMMTNVLSQLYLLEAVARHATQARVLVVGSSEEYGRPTDGSISASESAPLRPDSPYAASKVAQDYLGLQYFLGRKLDVIRVRPFNLFGPGQSDRFAIGSFARQIAEGEAELRPATVEVGNLTARRDYTDVRDAVGAYVALLRVAPAGEVYNVGGGGEHAVGDILAAMLQRARMKFSVEVDDDRFRSADSWAVIPDITRLQATTGWEPLISFDRTIHDILDDWRGRVMGGPPAGKA